MICTWLKTKRKVLHLSQEAVAAAPGQNVGTIRRWENCKSNAKKEVPYVDLARLLPVDAAQLCEDHLRDLNALLAAVNPPLDAAIKRSVTIRQYDRNPTMRNHLTCPRQDLCAEFSRTIVIRIQQHDDPAIIPTLAGRQQ